jgi:hypothetical protein
MELQDLLIERLVEQSNTVRVEEGQEERVKTVEALGHRRTMRR